MLLALPADFICPGGSCNEQAGWKKTEGRILTKEMSISCCFWRVLALAQKEDLMPERVWESHCVTISMRVTMK